MKKKPAYSRLRHVPTVVEPPAETLLSTAEVAERLTTSRQAVARWVRDGKLQGIRLPSGVLRIPESSVSKILAPPS